MNIYLDDLPVSCPSSSAFEDDDRTLTVLLLPSILNIVNGRGGPSSRSCVVPMPTRLVRPSLEKQQKLFSPIIGRSSLICIRMQNKTSSAQFSTHLQIYVKGVISIKCLFLFQHDGGQEAEASTRETWLWLILINKGADQPVHLRSLISAFVICYLKSTVTGSVLIIHSFGGLQHDKVSGYAREHEHSNKHNK